MEIGRGRRAMGSVATAVLLLAGAVVTAAAAGGGALVRPCFDACFDQCVQREEFWFCQFSCYRRCAGRAAARAGGCEQSCVLSMCGELHPDSKMMVVCRDTCRKSYAAAGCGRLISIQGRPCDELVI